MPIHSTRPKKEAAQTRTATQVATVENEKAFVQQKSGAPQTSNAAFPVVGVGASAGGLEAFTQLMRALPLNPGISLVLVQHLDPKHESMLVNIISRETRLPVQEAKSGMVVEPDHVYITPHDADLELSGGVFNLLSRTHVAGRHLPIDSFFRSLADDQKTCAIGVILSGTASDGVEGLKAIKAEGGITFAQEPQSAKYEGMPQNAIDSGFVDFVFPPKDIARELAKIGRNPQAAWYRKAPEEEILPAGGDALQKIFDLLRRTTGIDFSAYKSGTINRRIARRMILHKIDTLESFADFLRRNPTEVQTLCQDLLISVTSFFREPEVFKALTDTVLPWILKTKPKDAPLRIWVPGCSTGEEAYSMAMCATEFLGERNISAQIFATDVNEAAIEKARLGRYPLSIESHVSPERLKRFFVRLKDGYGIGESIRKLCIFARQDLTQDPPFSNLDLISCFNVLIYLGPKAQEKAIKMLHYALRPTGFLVLGKAEAISHYQDIFTLLDRRLRIYTKQPLSQRLDYGFGRGENRHDEATSKKNEGSTTEKFDLDREAERVILGRYGPPGFIVDEKLHILKLRGRTRPYLDPSPGEPSLNVLRMIRPELVSEVRTAVQKAARENSSVRRPGISIEVNGRSKEVDLQVMPISGPSPGERCFLLLIEEVKPPSKRQLMRMRTGAAKALKGSAGVDRRAILQLKHEFSNTKLQLRTVTQEAEAASEELQSANEELESRNEELQSANEELETAKEELQSANEELTTLNDALRERNEELSQSNSELEKSRAYSEAIVETMRYPVLVLDSLLRVQKANRAFYKTFGVKAGETLGRSLYELGTRQWDISELRTLLGKVLLSGAQFDEFEARPHFERIGFRDVLLDACRLEGSREEGQLVLLSIVDVTQIKLFEDTAKQKAELARSNEDLDQFAHAASHDLHEPLRMVISFLQMLSERYRGKLDKDADEWIGYAVDGAQRMQQLIEDLLAYAEVGRGGESPVPLSITAVLDEVRANLEAPVRETSAVIKSGPLPMIPADRIQMVQLFQNLMGNAIKFRGEEPPHIQISAKREGAFWIFSVADNGIGIAREHHDRIFSMFQRLHDRSRYPGAGIGLAVCRKIVIRLGGRIWVESEVGKGSVFYFTLPAAAESIPVTAETT
jgi:two-component system CheB/CheR fusion protein